MSALQKCGHRSLSLFPSPPALVQAATHSQITAFQGFMAEQVNMPENILEASLRLTAPEDPKAAGKALGWAADGLAKPGVMSSMLQPCVASIGELYQMKAGLNLEVIFIQAQSRGAFLVPICF